MEFKNASDDLSDFLLSFTSVGCDFTSVESANKDEMDDNKAAIVCVMVPGFMRSNSEQDAKL